MLTRASAPGHQRRGDRKGRGMGDRKGRPYAGLVAELFGV